MLEFFVGLGLKLLGWGGQLLKWLQTLPWYVLALAACVVVILIERHEWASADATAATQAAQLAKDRTELGGYRADLATDAQSIKTLESTVAAQNAAVDGYKAQSTAAQQAAALARAQAAQAAQGRAAAIAELKAAQARPVLNDCPAPTAHNDTRGQL
jgi:hypothetical protein